MNLTTAVNVLAVAALIILVVTVAAGVIDLARECWRPEPTVDTPGFRVLPRAPAGPFDWEREEG